MASGAPNGLPTLEANVRLAGKVDDEMLRECLRQLGEAARTPGPLLLELSTTGGDADIGRRIALEVRLLQAAGRPMYFFGKSTVYSAGITVMAAFPSSQRFLSADCSLLIHERRLEKELKLSGALRANIAIVKDMLAQLVHGQALERDGFEELVRDTDLSFDELMRRVMDANWYLRAPEALERRLVAGIV